MEAAGLPVMAPSRAGDPDDLDLQLSDDQVEFVVASNGVDGFAFVISRNLMRRHLNRAQKRGVIEKPRAARPELSDTMRAGRRLNGARAARR